VIDAELENYAAAFGPDDPRIRRLLKAAGRSETGRRIAKSVLRARLRRAGVDPDDNDPFPVLVPPEALGGEGLLIGNLVETDQSLIWQDDEIPYSALCVGDPGFGKTTLIISLLIQLAARYTAIVPDLRGDYECLCRAVPQARFFPFGSFPINLLRGSTQVPPATFNQRFSEVFTDQFDQRQSSRRYLNMVLDDLDAKRAETGHWPCVLDLLEALEDRKEVRGSDAIRFRDRCIARVDALRRALGDEAVGVEQGIDLEELVKDGTMLVFRTELEKSVQDFLTNWLLMYVFEHRRWAEDKFNQRPIVFVLDEQRSILSLRR